MATTNQNPKAEEIRHAALDFLYQRRSAALPTRTIRSQLASGSGLSYDLEALTDELKFLEGLGYLKSFPDALGSTLHWQITSNGVLDFERQG